MYKMSALNVRVVGRGVINEGENKAHTRERDKENHLAVIKEKKTTGL